MKTIVMLATSVGIAVPLNVGAADTRTIWVQNCASCHAKDGSGSTRMGRKLGVKDYRDPTFQGAFSDAEAERAIREGVKTNGKETMKPFGTKLTDSDIKGLVKYIRSFKK
jgi:mono/diheme cytochrome c family protein